MRICLVGGIYDKPGGYRQRVQWTPETTLERGLIARGHDVVTLGHRSSAVFSNLDLIHVHHLGRAAIAMASDRSQTPFVFTRHNAARSRLTRLALGAVIARADGVIALSQSEADRERRAYFLEGAEHAVIPTGVDAGRFQSRVPIRPNQGEPWRLLFAGQLIPMKRVDLLLEALARLRSRFSIHLRLAYHVDQQLEALRHQARSLGIEPIIEFAGPLTQSGLADAYREAHVVVLPSDNDSLPSVLTEAMMSGTPVVATDVGSVREQLAGYGLVVPAGSVDSLALGIEGMLTRYDSYSERSLAMSRSARDRFSVERMVQQHEDFYAAVLSGGHRARRHSRRNLIGNQLLRGALWAWNKIKS